MCLIKGPRIPEPEKPIQTQAARAPTRAWAADPAARRGPTVIGTGTAARTARPATQAPGTVLGR